MHVAMWAPLLPLLQALLLARASADTSGGEAEHYLEQQHRTRFSRNEPISCQAEGRLFSEGAVVSALDPCLRCKCDRGALSCRRLACSPPPGPPPPHCYLAHREGACCPELQCHDAAADVGRTGFATEDVYPEPEEKPSSHVLPVCVEGGTAYGAGSAMGTRTACELCFCLGGARRCVRPRCLPAPPGCRARAAPGACCPHSYRCDHDGTGPLDDSHLHDCNVGGKWVAEGERIPSPEADDDCAQCYCLRGKVRCQSLSCAPPLMGCKPLLEPGQCCPHQYQCTHQKRPGLSGLHLQARLDNAPVSIRNQDRSFRNAPASVTLPPPLKDTTTVLTNLVTEKTSPIVSADQQESIATTKVKRKTSDSPAKTYNSNPVKHVTTTKSPKTFKAAGTTAATAAPATDGATVEKNATEPPDSSVRIIINGTINCTTELSSTTFTMNFTNEDEIPGQAATEDAQARVPSVPPAALPHTYNPNDIITDRNYNGDFDEDESYAINVTSSLVSSLRTNSTSPAASGLAAHEAAKETSEGYQYKYSKPTLPPSLPNLKIIPFVAADAVVDDEISSKEALMYPVPETEDKYPVYYPSVEAKDVPFATRREDSYLPTQFPVFLSKKVDAPQYPHAGHRLDLADEYPSYPGHGDIITALREFTLAATLGNNPPPVNRASTTLPGHGTKFELATPADSLFSPPAETEGGFVPKDPGIIEDYFAPYPSTSPGSIVPYLTTSMQLDTTKECRSEDGRRVLEGESISVACSTCICSWGELHCSQRACPLHHPRPAGCARASADGCCGELICASVNESTPTPPSLTTRSVQVPLNTTEKPVASINSVEEANVLKSTSTAFLAIAPSEVKINYNYSKVPDNTTLETAMSDVKTHATESSVPNKLTTADEQVDAYSNSSQEYADEDDDEGFSFGTVLKLLLSDSYETTTSAPLKQFLLPATKLPASPPAPAPAPAPAPITTPTPTTKTQSFKPVTTAAALSSRIPYTSEKKHNLQNTINRIDHLILGEATAIKMTTPRPVTVHFEPTATKKSLPGKLATAHKAMTSARPLEEPKTPDFGEHKSVSQQRPAPGLGPGLLKLAGCNIYGQMYRVGRIIAELSTPCQECRCTELGVQCRQLGC